MTERSLVEVPAALLGAVGGWAASGGTAALDALRRAGAAAAATLQEALERRLGGPLADAPATAFATALAELLAAWGWGRLELRDGPAGLGEATLEDWVEVGPAGCPLTTGLLAGLLGRLAEAPLAALEVERDPEARRARLLFGAPARLEAVYRTLAAGQPLDAALAAAP